MRAVFKPIISAIGLVFALATSISAAPGDLDPTFGNGGIVISTGGSINTLEAAVGMALQADGKIIAVGYGSAGSNPWDFAVARYNTDGSLDSSFGGSGLVVTPVSNCQDFALSVAIQADGKIVVAGYTSNNGGGRPCDGGGDNFAVARYNPNGTPDTTFNGTGKVITQINNGNSHARSVTIQSDGKIVVAGDSGVSDIFTLVRYNTNGLLDTSFDNDGIITTGVGIAFAVAIQADGKIVAAGYGVIRYNTDGSLDTTFNGTGIVTTPGSSAYSVAIQADGKILTVSGNNGFSGNRLVRYNTNGTPDTSFGGTGSVAIPIFVSSAAVQANGKIVAAGSTEFGEGAALAVIRLNGDGSLDATFGGTGTVITPIVTEVYYSSVANAVAIQPDGKIVAAGGVVDRQFDLFDFALVRYQGDAPCSSGNPIDCPEFFTRQHYLDFLNREPDPAGLAFWTGEITSCGTDPQCIEVKRINVSAAFFLSIEFQQTGFYAIRLQRAAFGHKSADSSRLTLASFLPDARALSDGVVVGIGDWEQRLELNKQAYAERVAATSEFAARFPATQTPAEFVAALYNSARVTPTQAETDAAVAAFGGGGSAGRAAALRKVAESESVTRAELNPSFVLMEYFGYLRRDPDDAGYGFWLAKLEQFGGDYVKAEMVKAFINSTEYRQRFGQP